MDFKNFETEIQNISTEKEFLNTFPVFGCYPEFKKEFPPFKKLEVWKYIVLLYSEQSPLIAKVGDIPKRKQLAIDLAGIKKTNAENFDLVNNKTDIVNKMISRYFKANNNMLFESIISGEEAFSNLMKSIRDPNSEDKDIEKLYSKANGIRELVEKLKKEVQAIQSDVFKENISFSYSDDATMGRMEQIALSKKH